MNRRSDKLRDATPCVYRSGTKYQEGVYGPDEQWALGGSVGQDAFPVANEVSGECRARSSRRKVRRDRSSARDCRPRNRMAQARSFTPLR
ncbi:protein of unknown function [Methylocaldum szegediense]|uniref:Uncharacterized protein n=1 Tax=Methylocaldum szegediense TaxID=73780 RepID=A0ABM9I8P3_9GAMM|nr:protein of unknown function [Methylocaldum szegediense]